MKFNRIVLFLVVLSALLITACGPAQQQQSKGAFLGGTQGVVATFEPLGTKDPASNLFAIFDTEDFPLEIVLKNKGEESVSAGKANLKLLGPAKEEFQNIVPVTWETRNRATIDKISEFNPQGGEEIVSFTPTARAKFVGRVTTFRDVTWNLEYWYDYQTHVIANDVCFKGDPIDTKVCKIDEAKTFSVSGAPITVTKVEEDQGGKGVMILKLEVQNIGPGKATIPGAEFDNRFDQLRFSTDEPTKWECKSSGRENEARLVDKKAEIICRLKTPLQQQDLYTKQVRLTLEYTYKDFIQEKLRIKESAR